jgi:hypothetical protein
MQGQQTYHAGISRTFLFAAQIADQDWTVHMPHDPRVHGVQQEDQSDRELCLCQHIGQVSL